jgi:D-3-phosphoglycerate dehydrogenase
MPTYKIMLTDGLEENGQNILRVAAQVDDRQGISAEELLQAVGEYDALIVRGRTKLTPAVFAAGQQLRVIGRAGVGVDNIDLAAARAHGVAVVNSPLATSLAVAELTLGLMLALARALPQADGGLKRGQWLKKSLMGVELHGKTLGVIGMGNIGRAVAQRASAFGMAILGYDPLIPADEIQRRGAQPASLPDLYGQADMITLHVPLTAETHGMIDRTALSAMQRGVRLICTARGGLIDESALLEALESGQVGGAALDVFAQEPPGASPLVTHPRVVATPHIGAQTEEAQTRAAEDIASEVLAALRGENLRWRVA